MTRYFLKFYVVLALACGVQASSFGEFILNNYETILIICGTTLAVGGVLYLLAYCMEGMLELSKYCTLTLLSCLRCFWICFCCCCLYCGDDKEDKDKATTNVVTETESQPPVTNQPTNTTVVNIGGVTTQTTQPNNTNTPAMSMPVNNMNMPFNGMAMPTNMYYPANYMGMPCMPSANMSMPVNAMTMSSMANANMTMPNPTAMQQNGMEMSNITMPNIVLSPQPTGVPLAPPPYKAN